MQKAAVFSKVLRDSNAILRHNNKKYLHLVGIPVMYKKRPTPLPMLIWYMQFTIR